MMIASSTAASTTFCLASSTFFFFFNDTATTEIYTLSLHDALPIYERCLCSLERADGAGRFRVARAGWRRHEGLSRQQRLDRKSTRLNSSHSQISYAVFCLKKQMGEFTELRGQNLTLLSSWDVTDQH